MIAAQRRRAILRRIHDDGYVEASRLSAELGVDESTIRRDLSALARSGLVQRTHGGALPLGPTGTTGAADAAGGSEHAKEKRAIARFAAGLVADGESVALDIGSTTGAVAHELSARRDLTIVTCDLDIAQFLAVGHHVRLVVAGGELSEDRRSLAGPWTLNQLAGIHVDRAFIGASAVDAAGGAMTDDFLGVPLKRAMLAAARSAVLVADSSKFNRHAFVAFARIDDFELLLTDEGLPATGRGPFGPSLVCVAVEAPSSGEP
ncbi:MAG: DeoR/GlpR family DNA-binding transcription regulator [Acidimicrobiales bacterium]